MPLLHSLLLQLFIFYVFEHFKLSLVGKICYLMIILINILLINFICIKVIIITLLLFFKSFIKSFVF